MATPFFLADFLMLITPEISRAVLYAAPRLLRLSCFFSLPRGQLAPDSRRMAMAFLREASFFGVRSGAEQGPHAKPRSLERGRDSLASVGPGFYTQPIRMSIDRILLEVNDAPANGNPVDGLLPDVVVRAKERRRQ
jgi:hypothetical protein